MSEVNFYLKSPKAELSSIYLQFKYSGQKLKKYFNQTVNPTNWNFKKQRVKSNRETTSDGQHSLNDLLDKLEQVLLTAYRKEAATGIPDVEKLKSEIDSFLYQGIRKTEKPTFFELAERFISGDIKTRAGEEKSPNTTKTYKTVVGHLRAFERQEKYPVNFETITLEFHRRYTNHLLKKGLAQNTRAKHIQVIKAIMNEGFDLGYTSNLDHRKKKFSGAWIQSEAVYLIDEEISRLYEYDLSANKRLEPVRDLFVFACHVGLRFSDYSTIKPEHIVPVKNKPGEYDIVIKTKKTKQFVRIACSKRVLQIFKKYQNRPNALPKAPSNQKFNEYIKECCQLAGLTEKGRLISEPDLELHECVSSHTARRSFATNLYKAGYPILEIMKITGHKTPSAFLRYIKIGQAESADSLRAILKRWRIG